MQKKLYQWHPGFYAVLQIEFEKELEKLTFETEHPLNEKPLVIDMVVKKKNADVPIVKNIGRIFRSHNLIEYKSPDDYVSINDYYKVLGYACLYQSETQHIMEIPPEEITVTFVCSHFPEKLAEHLIAKDGIKVINPERGIYYLVGTVFPVQIVVDRKLPREENLWLSRLRDDLNPESDIMPLVELYKDRKKQPLYEAAMELLMRVNHDKVEEVKDMCQALYELFEEDFRQKELEGERRGKREGRAEAILELLNDYGVVPDSLADEIKSQDNMDVLKIWVRLAAHAGSVENFQRQMKQLVCE